MARQKTERPSAVNAAAKKTKNNVDHDDDGLIGIREVRRLLANCSEMHVWRLLNVERYAHLGFPRPTKINLRNYWRRRAVLRWIDDREDA